MAPTNPNGSVADPETGRARAGTVARETDPLLPPSSNGHTYGSERPTSSYEPSQPKKPTISPRRAAAVALAIWVLIFLQASNTSGMTMAQSAVATELDAYGAAMWFTSAYLIAQASFAPVVGRLATVFPAGYLLGATAICFAVGTAVTAEAATLAVFLLGRVIVGLGAAGVMTLSLITVLQLAPRKRRGLFVGLVNAGFTIGLSTGAVVYGALLPALGWRTLFLVQAPLALVAGVGVVLTMPAIVHTPESGTEEDKDAAAAADTTWQKLARIDYAGALLLTLTIVLFLYGLSGTAGTVRALPIVLSAGTLALFVAVEVWLKRRFKTLRADGNSHAATQPIIPLEVLKSRGVLLSCLAQLAAMAARWTVLYYAPIYVLAVRGSSAAMAGAVLVPTNVGFGTGGLVVGWLHVKRPGAFWLPPLVAAVLFAASLALVGHLSRAWPAERAAAGTALYVLSLFANGFCTGAFLNYTLAHLLHLTRAPTHFVATSLLATFRGFAGSFGTAIGGGYFMRRLADRLAAGFSRLADDGLDVDPVRRATLITRLVGSPALVFGRDGYNHTVLTPHERQVAVAGYEEALRSLYQWAALAAVLALALQAGTGWAEPKAKRKKAPPAAPAVQGGANNNGGVLQPPYRDDNDEAENNAGENGDVEVDEEEIREAIAEHDPTMEA